MFNDIGGKIKRLAQIVSWVGIIGSILGGLVMIIIGNNMQFGEGWIIAGIAVAVAGSLISGASCFVLYGFGELIDINREIAQNTRKEREAASTGTVNAGGVSNDNNTAATPKGTVSGKVGTRMTFGAYPQTESGTDATPIEWIVLDVQDGRALLISRFGLDAQRYNNGFADITWEDCTLRAWLNDTFLNKAFSSEEQKAILTTIVDNSQSQCYNGWSTGSGNNTEDKIFLLSCAEANKYFGVEDKNKKSRVEPTAYAIKNGAYTSSSLTTAEGKPAGGWWLRSPGFTQRSAACVNTDGSISRNSVSSDDEVIRPALWINLESCDLKQSNN